MRMSASGPAPLVVVVVMALVTAGCAAFEDPPEPTRLTAPPEGAPTPVTTTQAFTEADRLFARLMVQHHAQAVDLADLVPDRTGNPEVRTLAQEVAAARQPEVERLTAWLEEWGARTDVELADHPGMRGMPSEAQLRALREADGPEFDRLWLESMIRHHEGAVVMAETVLSASAHRPTLELAEDIRSARQVQITRMRAMLGP
jgi:uncharacterized protein (DUF305 family)